MKNATKRAVVIATTIITALGGYGGMASANTTVNTDGPDSGVNIRERINNNCSVNNSNNVKASNLTMQNAMSGNANVGGGSWSDWESWNPTVWQTRGFSYDEWHSAFMGYMNSQNQWGGNTHGGSATTGDATNNNSTNTMISIANGAGCAGWNSGGSGGVTVSTEGPGSGVGVVLGATNNIGVRNNNNAVLSALARQNALSGNANVSGNTSGGGSGSGGAGNANGTNSAVKVTNGSGGILPGGGGGSDGSNDVNISTQGPDSGVNFTSTINSNTSIVNSNNITTIATTTQNADSGNANVSGNTSGGSAGTGDATNVNGADTNVSVVN